MAFPRSTSGPALVRRSFLVATLGALGLPTIARAQQAAVPVALQVQLLSRVVRYDRTFTTRAGASAVVLVVHRAGNASSSRTGAQIVDALRRLPDLGGLPVSVESVAYGSASALAAHVTSRRPCIVYFSVGLSGDIGAISAALSGVSVLSVSAGADDASAGAVLAFELDEARPRLAVNLAAARRQQVAFSSNLLRLARVIDA